MHSRILGASLLIAEVGGAGRASMKTCRDLMVLQKKSQADVPGWPVEERFCLVLLKRPCLFNGSGPGSVLFCSVLSRPVP